MEGELAFHTPPRPPRVSFEGRDGCGFGSPSPTWASQLGTLRDSPSSCVSDGRGGGNGRSGFSSPTWGSPLESLFNAPTAGVSDRHVDGNGPGFSSPTAWGSTLETLFNSHSSRVSDSPGAGNGSTPKQASPLATPLNSPSSCVSDSRGGGNGSAFSTTKKASPREPLLNSPSSSASDIRGCGNSSSPRISKERDSEEVKKAESLLRAITERYEHCFLRLRDTTAELADLRRERVRLGAENLRLSLLLEELDASEQSKQASAVALTPPPKPAQSEAASTSKSISMPVKGFVSKKQPQGVATPQRLRVRASQAMEDAGEKEKDDGEVEVFRQGATKTELCNKWERGSCPYDGRCRFAHGMEELRPVIRHPRYKTLQCQLFAAGSGCPYGHRCHFRHAMAPTAESC